MPALRVPQVTGEAQYVDDLPLPNNALHAAFVLSTRPHAKILSIDSSAAEQVRFAPYSHAEQVHVSTYASGRTR